VRRCYSHSRCAPTSGSAYSPNRNPHDRDSFTLAPRDVTSGWAAENELRLSESVSLSRGPTTFERSTQMTTTETHRYRGYDIVPMWQWSSWCTGIYPTRADLPILSRSTLSTMAPEKEEAMAEAKHYIDHILSRLTRSTH
jgi:hypothetical protein